MNSRKGWSVLRKTLLNLCLFNMNGYCYWVHTKNVVLIPVIPGHLETLTYKRLTDFCSSNTSFDNNETL